MVSKETILDLKNQYLQKRDEVNNQLASLLEETKNLRANLNAFDGALACCDTILNGMVAEVQQPAEEVKEKPEPQMQVVERNQQQSRKTRR